MLGSNTLKKKKRFQLNEQNFLIQYKIFSNSTDFTTYINFFFFITYRGQQLAILLLKKILKFLKYLTRFFQVQYMVSFRTSTSCIHIDTYILYFGCQKRKMYILSKYLPATSITKIAQSTRSRLKYDAKQSPADSRRIISGWCCSVRDLISFKLTSISF